MSYEDLEKAYLRLLFNIVYGDVEPEDHFLSFVKEARKEAGIEDPPTLEAGGKFTFLGSEDFDV